MEVTPELGEDKQNFTLKVGIYLAVSFLLEAWKNILPSPGL